MNFDKKMLDIDRALRYEPVLRSLTGLRVRQSKALHKKFDTELLSNFTSNSRNIHYHSFQLAQANGG